MSGNISATQINYYHLCRRKLWLFSNGIQMEHTSDLVAEGKLIDETAYPQRAAKYSELEIGGSKIDYYDAANRVVHEVKKSNAREDAHLWQVRYYLYLLEQNGIKGATGILEYPRLRETTPVTFSESDRKYLENTLSDISEIIQREQAPPKIEKKKCKNCSYFDFCWADEESGEG